MNSKEQIISWLNDAYAMENSISRVLETHAAEANENLEMRSRLQLHYEETCAQAERVRECIRQLGGSLSTGKSLLAGLLGRAQPITTAFFADEPLKNLLMDYSTEHFEIACYRSLIHAADEIGADEVISAARQNLAEEQRMADWLLTQIPAATIRTLRAETSAAI